MATRIRVLGQTLRPFDSIPRVGEVLGFGRSSSYSAAEVQGWPLERTSPERVACNVVVLLTRLGLPFEVEYDPIPIGDGSPGCAPSECGRC